MKLRENLKDHPIQSILAGLASLVTIITFIIFIRTEACSKESVQEKREAALNSTPPEEKNTTLPNPDIKKDSSTVREDSSIKIAVGEAEKITSNIDIWVQEDSFKQVIKVGETAYMPGDVRMSVLIYQGYCYVNVFFPGETGRSYKNVELQLGEEKIFESKDFPYKFNITYLSNSNYYTTGAYLIKAWKKQ